jgi:hypothetical protein
MGFTEAGATAMIVNIGVRLDRLGASPYTRAGSQFGLPIRLPSIMLGEPWNNCRPRTDDGA